MRLSPVIGILLLCPAVLCAADEPLQERLIQRFVRYAQVGTQSREGAPRTPSTESQRSLAKLLESELKAMGLKDVRLTAECFLYASLPSNLPPAEAAKIPVIGFISHLDTSPAVAADPVKPVVHRKYPGGDLVLPGDRTVVLTTKDNPALKAYVGQDIITSDGTTLLGADDKCGIAEIMTAIEELQRHPEVRRGEIRVAFTPDEEVGRDLKVFDRKGWGAKYAYTVDGGDEGEVNAETFNADTAIVKFEGHNYHPGEAKGKMINSMYAAAAFVAGIPAAMRPESCEGRQGYIHPTELTGNEESSTVKLILRDFRRKGLEEKAQFLRQVQAKVLRQFRGVKGSLTIEEHYRNMKEVLDRVPFLTEFAVEAVTKAGAKVIRKPVRGGLDGSELSFLGLPTANLFTGGWNFHSRSEWAAVPAMERAVKSIVNLTEIWATKGQGK